MVEFSKPVDAVTCPKTGKVVAMTYCETKCKAFIERRRPWRYWAIKCDPEAEEA